MQYRGLTLDPFQTQAIEALAARKSVLVCAPTGTGKTIVADWLVDQALARGREVVYTAPIKALSNQKFRDWTRLYGDEKVGLLTGDLVIRREAPCRVMTTEILRNMLLQGEDLSWLEAVIVDEIHFLDDRERGTVWEELLIYLPTSVQILGLSATLANAGAFAAWISSVRGTPVEVIRQEARAVPLELHIANLDDGLLSVEDFDRAHQRWLKKHGRVRHPPAHRGRRGRPPERHGPSTSHADVFEQLRDHDLLPALYFCFSRKGTEQNARALGRRLRRSLLDPEQQAASDRRLAELAAADPQLLDPELRELYRMGIAFHHAGLHVALKALVEELYERRLIQVLYCTSTFALGINLPARTVAFDALRKFDGISTRPLTTREFMQKAGRAGRRGMDTVGHVVIRVDHEDWDLLRPQIETYRRNEPEPVRSSFSLSFHSVVNLLARHPMERIREIVEKSFLNFHHQGEARRLVRDARRLRREAEEGGERRKLQREAERLEQRAEGRKSRTWEDFQARVSFLKRVGYLEDDLSFAAGARVLQHVQIEEIFVTELVLAGVFEGLPTDLLFGLLCAMNKELPREASVRERLRGPAAQAAHAAERVRRGPVVTSAEAMTRIEVTWCPPMIPFGVHWARGRSFSELMRLIDCPTDISGDLVNAFRRAKDLAGQLKAVWADDEARARELHELIQRVSRDEVLVVD